MGYEITFAADRSPDSPSPARLPFLACLKKMSLLTGTAVYFIYYNCTAALRLQMKTTEAVAEDQIATADF